MESDESLVRLMITAGIAESQTPSVLSLVIRIVSETRITGVLSVVSPTRARILDVWSLILSLRARKLAGFDDLYSKLALNSPTYLSKVRT